MTHIIRFPIGDWSDDGHGKCEYFMIKSSMLELERIEPEYEDINFYGSDDKNKHLKTPGYGIF